MLIANLQRKWPIKKELHLKQELKVPFVHLCNGKLRLPHRFMGPSLGVAITFAVHEYAERYSYNQPTIRSMKAVFDNMHWNIYDIR